MLQEDYDKMTIELEPFREEFEGKRIITAKTQYKWLESKGIIRFGKGIYSPYPMLVYPKGMTDAEVSMRYERHQDMLSDYMTGKILQHVGKMGAKNPSPKPTFKKDEINPEDIPF